MSAAVVSLGLAVLGWPWALGVWWGLAAVAAARAAGFLLDRNSPAGRPVVWASIAALGGQLLMATLALGGVAAGLPALGVVSGLGSAAFGLWVRAWALARAA